VIESDLRDDRAGDRQQLPRIGDSSGLSRSDNA
jgi:hypothetical protein